MNAAARPSSSTIPAPPPETEATDHATRAKRLARMFGWCPKCAGPLQDGHCEPCAVEEAKNVVAMLEASIRRARNRHAPNKCAPCDGAGAVDGFCGLTKCFVCRGAGLVTGDMR